MGLSFQKVQLIVLSIIVFSCAAKAPHLPPDKELEVMFYNVENLFDTLDDPKTDDQEYLPNSFRKWDQIKYESKISNLAKVIHSIDEGDLPDWIGLCEVENKMVVRDLAKATGGQYAISHFNSPDHRGIDVALLYNDSLYALIEEKPLFVVLQVPQNILDKASPAEAEELLRKNGNGNTRNILRTTLHNSQDTFVIYTCHFPSRRGGMNETSYKREQAASILKKDFDAIKLKHPSYKVLIMGDFNDEPSNVSIQNVLRAEKPSEQSALNNLFYTHDEDQDGSYRYRDQMNMLDQIIISANLWSEKVKAKIYNPSWLIQTGKYAGYPLRTFGGKNYLNGYSDHFPVFAQIPLK